MRKALLLAVLVWVVTAVAGCGGDSEPSQLEHETAAVERLLAAERAAIRDGDKAERESGRAQRQAHDCLNRGRLVCVEAGATVLEATTRDLEHATSRIQRIHREINSYSSAAIEAAYGAR